MGEGETNIVQNYLTSIMDDLIIAIGVIVKRGMIDLKELNVGNGFTASTTFKPSSS